MTNDNILAKDLRHFLAVQLWKSRRVSWHVYHIGLPSSEKLAGMFERAHAYESSVRWVVSDLQYAGICKASVLKVRKGG